MVATNSGSIGRNRSIGRNSDPEQFHLLARGKTTNFNLLALLQIFGTPIEFVNAHILIAVVQVPSLADKRAEQFYSK